MPRVLLTGGSGFIASHILNILITKGYHVVTTVRSTAKANKIKASYDHLGKEQLDFVIVEDVAQPGAFDQAVIAEPPFDAVIHTASPFHFNVTDVQRDLLDPAVNGTSGILKSISQNARSVKKVVITSSFAAVVNPFKGSWPEHIYTEEDWNPITREQAVEGPVNGYRASKTFAERAAWDFMHREKPTFTLTTLCPPQVFGPVMPHLGDIESLNTSNQVVRDLMQGKFRDKIPPNGTFTWVDVRDLAKCHVLALEAPEASNKRFLVTAGRFCNRELVDIVRRKFGRQCHGTFPSEKVTGGAYPDGGLYEVDSTRVVDVLGVRWRSLEDSIMDTVKSLQAVGLQ